MSRWLNKIVITPSRVKNCGVYYEYLNAWPITFAQFKTSLVKCQAPHKNIKNVKWLTSTEMKKKSFLWKCTKSHYFCRRIAKQHLWRDKKVHQILKCWARNALNKYLQSSMRPMNELVDIVGLILRKQIPMITNWLFLCSAFRCGLSHSV